MELTNQVATLQDEVKLLKGEIKTILKEIRTAVLTRDNPFAAGLDSMAIGGVAPAASPITSLPIEPARPEPAQAAPTHQGESQAPPPAAPTAGEGQAPAPTLPPQEGPPSWPSSPPRQGPAGPIIIQGGGGGPAAPAWAGPVPPPQPAPAPFVPAAYTPPQPGPAAEPVQTQANTQPAGWAVDASAQTDEPANEVSRAAESAPPRDPIPLREFQDERPEQSETPPQSQPSWSLPSLASLAVWAEDALVTLGPRRFLFVLELATFADLISADAREVLSGLVDADVMSGEDERPLNVNECLVVLRQLDAIVHGEKVVKLPRRRGIRHRRVR